MVDLELYYFFNIAGKIQLAKVATVFILKVLRVSMFVSLDLQQLNVKNLGRIFSKRGYSRGRRALAMLIVIIICV